MALYIPHSIFHLARLLYVRPETFGPCYVALTVGVTIWLSVLTLMDIASTLPVLCRISYFTSGRTVLTCPRIQLTVCGSHKTYSSGFLTFRILASYIQDGRKITLQMPHFIFIQQISILNILSMLYNLHFFFQNAVYFIMLPCLVSVLLKF